MRPPPLIARTRGAAAQRAADIVHVDLLPERRQLISRSGAAAKPAGDMDRSPQRRDALVGALDHRLIGEIARNDELHLLVVAQAEALRLSLIEARHMADRAGLDQRRHDGSAERAGAAGDHHMTVAKIHGASSPICLALSWPAATVGTMTMVGARRY